MSDLPDDVTGFLDEHITSVMQLEVLLALRASGGEALSVRHLLRAIGGSVDQVLRCVMDLQRSGLVTLADDEEEVHARYSAGGALDATVGRVGDEYARRKVRVVRFVLRDRTANPLDSFSDAFRLRRDDD